MFFPPFEFPSSPLFEDLFTTNSITQNCFHLPNILGRDGSGNIVWPSNGFHSLTVLQYLSWIEKCISLKCSMYFFEGGNIISDCKWQVGFPSGSYVSCLRPVEFQLLVRTPSKYVPSPILNVHFKKLRKSDFSPNFFTKHSFKAFS